MAAYHGRDEDQEIAETNGEKNPLSLAWIVLRDAAVEALAIDELTELVIGAAIAVHMALGPGLLESIYRDAMVIELTARGITVKSEERVPVFYRGQRVRGDLKIDLLVDKRLIVEIKAVDRLNPVFQAQVLSYLKLTGHPAGLLLNFNATTLRAGLKRLDHPDVYASRHTGAAKAATAVTLGGRGSQESKR